MLSHEFQDTFLNELRRQTNCEWTAGHSHSIYIQVQVRPRGFIETKNALRESEQIAPALVQELQVLQKIAKVNSKDESTKQQYAVVLLELIILDRQKLVKIVTDFVLLVDCCIGC